MTILYYCRDTSNHTPLGDDLTTTTGTSVSITVSTSSSDVTKSYHTNTNDPNLLDWANGTYTWYLKITTANANVSLKDIIFRRYQKIPSTSILATKTTAINQTLSSVQTYSGTITWDDGTQNPAGRQASDAFNIAFVFTRSAGHGGQDIIFEVNTSSGTRINTPFTAGLRNLEKSISDSITVVHTSTNRSRMLLQTRSDSVTVAEGPYNRLRGLNQTVGADSLTISSGTTGYKGLITSISNSLNISELISKQTDRLRTFDDSFGISDSIGTLIGKLKSISDSISISELVSKSKDTLGEISDNLTISETISRLRTIDRIISDSVLLSELNSRLLDRLRTLSDSVVLSHDPYSKLTTRIRTVLEDISIDSDTVRERIKTGLFSDSITFSESINNLKNKIKSISESIIISPETISKLASKSRNVLHSITISESMENLKEKVANMVDSISFSDSSENLRFKIKLLSDSITLSHTGLVLRGLLQTASDSFSLVTEEISRLRDKISSFSVSINLDESINYLQSKLRHIIQSINLEHNLEYQTSRLRTFVNNLSLSEIIETGGSKVKFISQSLNISETLTRLRDLNKDITTQNMTLTEQIQLLRNKIRLADHPLSFSSISQKLTTRFREFTHNLNFTENIETGGANLIKNISQTLNLLSTDITRSTTRLRSISIETLNLTDSLSRIVSRLRVLDSESITFTDLTEQIKLRLAVISGQNLGLSDIHSRSVERIRAFSDSLSISSAQVWLTSRLRSISETLSLADSSIQTVLSSLIKTISESISISDGAERTKGKLKTITDNVLSFTSDTLTSRPHRIKVITNQTFGISHTTSRMRLFIIRSINHNVTLSSTVIKSIKSAVKTFSIKIKRLKKFRFPY